MGTYLFISDVHLGLLPKEDDLKLEQKLVSFLQKEGAKADHLYILGDLFDYWFEYRRVIQKGYFKLFTVLKQLTESGVNITYIVGNHDFFHRDFFEEYLGVKVEFNTVSADLDGKKFFMAHGDGLIQNDTGYKILKVFLRNRFIQWLFSVVHPDFGIWLASLTSKTSRSYTTNKDYGENDALFITSKEKIDEGYDYVLFGHSHSRTVKEYKNGYYINLGTWLAQPCFGLFKNGTFEILNWNENGSRETE